MLKVGVTGGLGSGKSVVCNILSQFGIPVFNADTEAKKLLEQEDIKARVLHIFGNSIADNGVIDRKKLSQRVFADTMLLQKLNNLIHPALADVFIQWAGTFFSSHPYIVIEAALLIESRQYFNLDFLALVFSPLEMRIERAMKRDGVTREEVMARISNQIPDEEKIKYTDFILYNDDDHMLLPQVLELDKMLREKHS